MDKDILSSVGYTLALILGINHEYDAHFNQPTISAF